MMRKFKIFFVMAFVLLASCSKNKSHDLFTATSIVDSIRVAIETSPKAYQDSLPVLQKIINEKVPDSVKSKSTSKWAYAFYNAGDLEAYYSLSHKSLKWAQNVKDSLQIAIVYNDISDYHNYNLAYDSAFFYVNKAITLTPSSQLLNLSRFYLNRASILFYQNSLVEAEVDAVISLKYADELKSTQLQYEVNNLLGGIHHRLKDYSTALNYYSSSLEYVHKLHNDERQYIYYAITYNNLGYVYLLNNDFGPAEAYLKKGLGIHNLKNLDPNRYASLLDNYAYSRMKSSKIKNVEADMMEALNIRKQIKNVFGEIVSLRRLGEFYISQNDTLKAVEFINTSLELAKSSDTYNEVLSAMELLANLEPQKREKYLTDYIRISDSLQQAERNVRDKFLRIAYETDRVVKERDSLLRERQYAIAGIIGLVVLIGLLVFIFRLQIRQKQLLFKQKEQQINQEFYMQLVERAGEVEKARLDEKNRVSKELHDGVLSAIVSVRLQLMSQLKESDLPNTVEKQVSKLGEIEKDIRLLSHDLRSNSKLSQESFPKLIQEWCMEFEETREISVYCEMDRKIDWYNVPVHYKIHIYRIVQEAFQNIFKYAQATFAHLEITQEEDGIHFLIFDDGLGFEVDKKRKGIGIKNMTDRAKEMNTELKILSSPGNGTSISFVLPL